MLPSIDIHVRQLVFGEELWPDELHDVGQIFCSEVYPDFIGIFLKTFTVEKDIIRLPHSNGSTPVFTSSGTGACVSALHLEAGAVVFVAMGIIFHIQPVGKHIAHGVHDDGSFVGEVFVTCQNVGVGQVL